MKEAVDDAYFQDKFLVNIHLLYEPQIGYFSKAL